MASFFDYRIAALQKADTITMAWYSNLEHPLLAVSTANSTVCLYMEEGERNEDVVIRRNTDALVLAWHPTIKLLAIGWKDGAVSLWSESDKMQREDNVVHGTAISFLVWSPDGTRLVSGDQNGVCGVWKTDQRGRLAPICQYNKNGGLTHCVFRTRLGGGIELKMPPSTAGSQKSDLSSTPVISGPAPPFFFGGENGSIFLADDLGNCTEVFGVGGPVASLLYYEEKDSVLVMNKSLTIMMYKVGSDGKAQQQLKVKLSAAGDGSGVLNAIWAGPGILASVTNESLVRLWNIEGEDNFILTLSDPNHMIKVGSDRVCCISYNPRKGVLAGGTRDGRVVMWRCTVDSLPHGEDPTKFWEALPAIELGSRLIDIQWGPGETLLSSSMTDTVSILSECVLYRRFRARTAVMQLTAQTALAEKVGVRPVLIKASIRIGGVDTNGKQVVVWNNKKVEVYDVSEPKADLAKFVAGFQRPCSAVAIHQENVYIASSTRVEVCNLQGVIKQTLAFSEPEGDPVLLDIGGNFLAVATKNGLIKIWDISRRDAKQIGAGRRFEEGGVSIGVMSSIRVNHTGTRVSILSAIAGSGGIKRPDTKLYVYEVDTDSIVNYDFGPKRYPVSHFWDPSEPKLFGCETKRVKAKGVSILDATGNPEIEAVTMFASPEYGLLMQDSFAMPKDMEGMIGVSVPFLYFMTKSIEDTSQGVVSRLGSRVLRDFVGMENADDATRDALLNFSYFLTTGNMDEAYKSVKLIENASVWENMATMCVKTKRLDVAEVCLGNMGNARGARAVREAKQEPEVEAKVAMVAIQLGLLEDAERLYSGCQRYDLLNLLYQASGQWDKAVQLAQKYDRIHLRTTHYSYAKYLEAVSDFNGALKEYQASDTHRYEVPRMLFDMQMTDELEKYIISSEDKELFKWWAQFCESNSNFDKALHYYGVAQDFLSLVRVHCFRKEFTRAAEIVNESGSASAAYHLGRQYENAGMIREAIEYFSKAGRFNHATRLARENNMENDLLNLALQSSSPRLMAEAAKYFEERGVPDRAVMLYHKSGNVARALDLAFRSQLFDALKSISGDLGPNTDPDLLVRCADFFLQHQQFEKAANLLIMAGNVPKALEVCEQHNVVITEEMAERMTPSKPIGPGGEKEAVVDSAGPGDEARNQLLMHIAKICKKQGSFHLATKKYTQAGNKLKAMKSLLKSGDTEKIIFFAGVSRQKEIYIIAANYLQSLDWHNDPEIMKNIIKFYTNAKAFDSLASFYDACAQVEIDEYRDYEKALGALREALKYMLKAKVSDKDDRVQSLQQRIFLVERFVQARKLVRSEPTEMVRICHDLLQQNEVETALRVGDVYALLIEFYYDQRNIEQAYHLIEKMRERNIILSPYLDQEMVEKIYEAMGVEVAAEPAAVNEDIGEDIQED
eukprot:CAMPEP_0184673476 /NCGR_PEP_ID=MMETSP0308-20130426/86689_1 /TAXON_ID=38269 /ORGANISM="Gloeochaete witrockiana, Strain SAG 46.84" /LENGTH=1407 /DNA_ID=CAMNT_0027120965 /DNA_START=36 /DNA_END=4259 /DNA_ORIENTATION=-